MTEVNTQKAIMLPEEYLDWILSLLIEKYGRFQVLQSMERVANSLLEVTMIWHTNSPDDEC